MTQIVRNVYYTVLIDKLNPDDQYATIVTANNPSAIYPYSPDDLGESFTFVSAKLKHSIINLSVKSEIELTLSSKANAAIVRSQSNRISDDNIPLTTFLKNLSGRPVIVTKNYTVVDTTQSTINPPSYSKIIYSGFIAHRPESITKEGALVFTLECMSVLGQLAVISSNSSWSNATKDYGNIFTNVVGNTITLSKLNFMLTNGTLLGKAPTYFNGSAPALPNPIWAFITPQKSKLAIMQELLIPYSRIIYQTEDGRILIRPLFFDDHADSVFNGDVYNNDSHILQSSSNSNASFTPNRVDAYFAPSLPVPLFGAPAGSVSPQLFASAPIISANNTIQSQAIGNLDYTQIYSTSTKLYNSGKYQIPQMRNIDIDNGIIQNKAGILNPLMAMYGSKSLGVSNIRDSTHPQYNTIPQLYSQIFLAENNTNNYNASITFNYPSVIQADSPLGKIVSIYNLASVDYPDMIVTDTLLDIHKTKGSNFTIGTAPLLSITGVWFSTGGESY